MNAISVVQALGVGAGRKRDIKVDGSEKMWFEDHLNFFSERYAITLEIDRYLNKNEKRQIDARTGHELTTWDVLMSHVYPLQHNMHPGLNSSFWAESLNGESHHHGYVSLSNMPDEVTFFGHRFRMNLPTRPQLAKRQCEQSDNETTYNEAPPHNWCEQGQSVGAEGVYTSYKLSDTDADDDDSAHLKLGNDSYAYEMAMLEGQLAYLGGRTNVCENVTYNNMPLFFGLHQVEFPGDTTAGFDSCT
jgi:hypothetical protein